MRDPKTGTTLAVYAALCLHSNYKLRIGETDAEKVMTTTRLSKTVVYRAFQKLVKAGIIGRRDDGMFDLPLDAPVEKIPPRGTGDSPTGDSDSPTGDSTGSKPGSHLLSEKHSESSSESPTAEALCLRLQAAVENHRGKRPKITGTWITDMDRLLRLGLPEWDEPAALSPEEVIWVIDGTFSRLATPGTSGFCWADQIRSPGSLRAKWDTLVLQLKPRARTNGHAQQDGMDFVMGKIKESYAT